MTRFVREKPLLALLAAVAVVIVGRLVDLQWHLTHDEFEGTTQQIRAHLVVWIGVLMVFTVSAWAVRGGIGGVAFRLALAGATLYIPVALWHFIEHASGNDPEVAHILIVIADVAIIGGGVIGALMARRQPQAANG